MSHEPTNISPVFRIDVSAESGSASAEENLQATTIALLRQLVIGQQQQNKLLEELGKQTAALHKQRANELQQWKDANPQLAKSCRKAAETLSKVQTQFLETLTEEINHNGEDFSESEYMVNEFVDRFGPRLAHLNGVLQVLAQLGSGIPAEK